jgi:hypothetical protein
MASLREQLEDLIRAEEATRLHRLALDRAHDPPGYARADTAWAAATRQLAAAAREALRETGLLRDASRALRGTGYTITRFPLEDGVLRVELAGGPDNPVEFLHVPSATDALRRLLDDFHATTGLEVRMPDELVT